MPQYVAIVGTNSKKSTNRQLLQYMQQHFADQADIKIAEIDQIPLFDKPADGKLPESAQKIVDEINASDGVIIAASEYDHSITAALSNALEWFSYKQRPFINKPVFILGASYGSLGTSRAQAHLRQILDSPELKARIMPGSEFLLAHSLQAFDDQNNLVDQKQAQELDRLFNDFLVFSK